MKTYNKIYNLSVVTTQAETYTYRYTTKNKKEASAFLDGMAHILEAQGKSIFIKRVKLLNY